MKLKYFVLNPKSKEKNDICAEASRDALEAYAWAIRNADPKLSRKLLSWSNSETIKHNKMFTTNDGEDENENV